MVIGVLKFELLVHGSESLKDKRRVVRSIKDRLHREHQVSVAEIGLLDRADVAVLGLACVARDGARAGAVLDAITGKLRALTDAELGETHRSMLHTPGDDDEAPEGVADEAALARELLEHFEADPEHGS